MLSLSQALKMGRLNDFISQDEACGVGPTDSGEAMQAHLRRETSVQVKMMQVAWHVQRTEFRSLVDL